MTPDMLVVLALTAGAMLLFFSERIPTDVTAVVVLVVLALTGLVTPAQAVAGFSNPATITIAAMFILSAGMIKTGVISLVGQWVGITGRGKPTLMLMVLLVVVALLSGILNNTPVVAVFIPVVFKLAEDYEIPPAKLLIPLSFAAIIGGTLTLIGTGPNLLVDAILRDHGLQGFGMFEFSRFGLVLLVAGMTYMVLVGRHLLPEREPDGGVVARYGLEGFLVELWVPEDSPLVGQTVTDLNLQEQHDILVLGIVRKGERFFAGLRSMPLAPDDILIAEADVENVLSLADRGWLDYEGAGQKRLPLDENEVLAEGILAPNSPLIGRSAVETRFRSRFGVFILALRRRGATLRQQLSTTKLQYGDVLLLQGPAERMAQLRQDRAFILLEERERPRVRWQQAGLAIAVLAGVVVLNALGVLPIVVATIAGALAMVLLGIVRKDEAYQAVDWSVIMLIAGVIPLGTALQNTGTAQWLAESALVPLGAWGPVALIGGLYLMTSGLTEVISNQAAAILMAPIAISVAQGLGVDPQPLAFTIAFACSASFMTPVGYQTNAMVYGAGSYRFGDFTRIGLPLNLLFAVLAAFLIPVIWPL